MLRVPAETRPAILLETSRISPTQENCIWISKIGNVFRHAERWISRNLGDCQNLSWICSVGLRFRRFFHKTFASEFSFSEVRLLQRPISADARQTEFQCSFLGHSHHLCDVVWFQPTQLHIRLVLLIPIFDNEIPWLNNPRRYLMIFLRAYDRINECVFHQIREIPRNQHHHPSQNGGFAHVIFCTASCSLRIGPVFDDLLRVFFQRDQVIPGRNESQQFVEKRQVFAVVSTPDWQTIVYELGGYSPNSDNVILKWYPPIHWLVPFFPIQSRKNLDIKTAKQRLHGSKQIWHLHVASRMWQQKLEKKRCWKTTWWSICLSILSILSGF